MTYWTCYVCFYNFQGQWFYLWFFSFGFLFSLCLVSCCLFMILIWRKSSSSLSSSKEVIISRPNMERLSWLSDMSCEGVEPYRLVYLSTKKVHFLLLVEKILQDYFHRRRRRGWLLCCCKQTAVRSKTLISEEFSNKALTSCHRLFVWGSCCCCCINETTKKHCPKKYLSSFLCGCGGFYTYELFWCKKSTHDLKTSLPTPTYVPVSIVGHIGNLGGSCFGGWRFEIDDPFYGSFATART